ncbi:MAG: hypothetical protein GEU91_24400 [Rhizobiales bacterium]|nr:hypothetical protein [Hyphomicrobiales bacterium]
MQQQKPRTAIREFSLDLLDFMQERLQECLADPASCRAALSDASCAFRILRRRLRAEAKDRFTQLVLVYDGDLESLANLEQPELANAINDTLDRLRIAARIIENG